MTDWRGLWRGVLPIALMLAMLTAHPAAAVNDPVWQFPATQLTASGQSPEVVSSSDGNRLTAVWRTRQAGKWVVQSSSSGDGGSTWGPVIDLSAAGQNARDPDVACSSDGQRITAVWSRFDGTAFVVQSRSSPDGGSTWGPAVDMATPASSPQISSSANGASLTAVWSRWDGSTDVVQTARSTDGGITWTAASDLSTDGGVAPRITGSTDGNALTVAWLHQDLSLRNSLQVRRSTDGGLNWDPVNTLTAPGEDAGFVHLAGSADGGRVAAIWVYSTGAQWSIRTRVIPSGGQTWNPTIDLATSAAGAGSPWLTMSHDGSRLTALWTRSDGERWVAQTRQSTDGGVGWSAVQDLTAADRNALDSHLASSADGTRLTAVWSRSNGTNYIAQARTSTDGGATWSPPADLSDAGQDVSPRITSSADGTRLNAIWGLFEAREGPVQTVAAQLRFPGFVASPSVVDFGGVEVGTQTSRTVTVTNDGAVPLTVSGIEVTGGFALGSQTCTNAAIAAGGTCTATVTFTPAAPGAATGTVRFQTNTVSGNHTVSLSGTGTSVTPTPTATPTPTQTPAPEPVKQSVTVKVTPVKAGATANLPKRTSQGSPLTWKSASKRICTVKKGKIKTLRKGRCTLRASAPATPGYQAYETTVRIRVK